MEASWPYSELNSVPSRHEVKLGWEIRFVSEVGWYATDGVYSTDNHVRISDALKDAAQMQARIDDELGIR